MTCQKCNNGNQQGNFCCNCGNPLREKCPECGEMEIIGRPICESKLKKAKDKQYSYGYSPDLRSAAMFLMGVSLSGLLWATEYFNISPILTILLMILIAYKGIPKVVSYEKKMEQKQKN